MHFLFKFIFRLKRSKLLIYIVLCILFSCSNANEKESIDKKSEPIQVLVGVFLYGETDKVKYDLWIKNPYKVISQEDEVVLKGDTVKFYFETYSQSDIKVNVKTFDSFGPEVNLIVLIDGKVWYTTKNSYQIELDAKLP